MADLVLGASGFLGSALARALAGSGAEVLAVGRRFPDGHTAPGVDRIVCDLYALPQEALDALVARATVVHHLAWSSLPASAEADPCRDQADNLGFMVRLLTAVRRARARLVFCSSGGTVYGASGADPICEDAPLRPIGAYGAAKAAAEVYAGLYRDGYGCDVRIARLANPFGEGQRPERLQGAASRFAAQAVAGEEIEIWGDGGVVRDYLHVSDAVAGLRALADAPREALGPSAVFNIASGRGASLNELVARLEAVLGRPVAVRRRPGRSLDVPRNVLDIARARQRLGWTPVLSLEEGLARLVDDLQGRGQAQGQARGR